MSERSHWGDIDRTVPLARFRNPLVPPSLRLTFFSKKKKSSLHSFSYLCAITQNRNCMWNSDLRMNDLNSYQRDLVQKTLNDREKRFQSQENKSTDKRGTTPLFLKFREISFLKVGKRKIDLYLGGGNSQDRESIIVVILRRETSVRGVRDLNLLNRILWFEIIKCNKNTWQKSHPTLRKGKEPYLYYKTTYSRSYNFYEIIRKS